MIRVLVLILMAGAAEAGPAPDAPLDTPLACLARTIYFEARGEPERGMAAVAHVVLNRVAHRDFPGSVCAVIRDGGSAPPCQFSWWCDGRPDRADSPKAHARSIRIARGVLSGRIADPTDGAVMFHSKAVKPRWTRAARLSARIGAHLFYQLDRR